MSIFFTKTIYFAIIIKNTAIYLHILPKDYLIYETAWMVVLNY